MRTEDRIRCQGCGRAVVPQLMVDDRNKFYRPVVTHLCPFCGAVLHVSGGELERGMVALVVGSSIISILIVVFAVVMLGD